MHVDWKWGPFRFKAGLDATKFVFLCVFTVYTDLFKNLGKTTIQNWKKKPLPVDMSCSTLSLLKLTINRSQDFWEKKLIPWPLTEGWMDYIVIWWTCKEKWNSLIYFDSEPVLIQRISDCFLFIWNEKNIMKIIFNIAG